VGTVYHEPDEGAPRATARADEGQDVDRPSASRRAGPTCGTPRRPARVAGPEDYVFGAREKVEYFEVPSEEPRPAGPPGKTEQTSCYIWRFVDLEIEDLFPSGSFKFLLALPLGLF